MNQSAITNAYRKRLGQFGEQFAATALSELGMQVLARNWRYGRQGELDIVALLSSPQTESTLVFVEVKTRTNNRFGETVEALGIRQQQRLLLLAAAFIQAHPQYAHLNQRFDLVCVYSGSGTPQPGYAKPDLSGAGHGWNWFHLVNILDAQY